MTGKSPRLRAPSLQGVGSPADQPVDRGIDGLGQRACAACRVRARGVLFGAEARLRNESPVLDEHRVTVEPSMGVVIVGLIR